MIHITGDTHGDLQGFRSRNLKQVKKGDYLIICGDFGFLWDNSPEEQKALKWLSKQKYNILFIHGTHDNLDMINSYNQMDFMGGQARVVAKNIFCLTNGHIFTIEGKNIFVYGGGESDDIDARMENDSWWLEELPTGEKSVEAINRLDSFQGDLDYVITHQAYPKIESALTGISERDHGLNTILNHISKNIKFDRWFFGKYHVDKTIPPKYVGVFNQVIPAYDKKKKQ